MSSERPSGRSAFFSLVGLSHRLTVEGPSEAVQGIISLPGSFGRTSFLRVGRCGRFARRAFANEQKLATVSLDKMSAAFQLGGDGSVCAAWAGKPLGVTLVDALGKLPNPHDPSPLARKLYRFALNTPTGQGGLTACASRGRETSGLAQEAATSLLFRVCRAMRSAASEAHNGLQIVCERLQPATHARQAMNEMRLGLNRLAGDDRDSLTESVVLRDQLDQRLVRFKCSLR